MSVGDVPGSDQGFRYGMGVGWYFASQSNAYPIEALGRLTQISCH